MKRLLGLLAVLGLLVGYLGLSLPQPAQASALSSITFHPEAIVVAETRNAVEAKLKGGFSEKLDINNAAVRAFSKYPGMYPTIATIVIKNAPYSKVEDVLKIPNLTAKQKEILEANIGNLIVTDPDAALVQGQDRYNNGLYGD